MSGVLELTRRGLFLATVTPDKRPSEMYVSPWANMLRMDAVSAARFALNGIEIWEEVLNVTMPTRATFKST